MLQVFSKGETCFRSMWLKRLVSREAIDNVDEYSDRYIEEQPEARLDELDHGNPMSFHTIRTSFCRMVFPFISPKVSHCVLSRPMVSQCINNLGMFGWSRGLCSRNAVEKSLKNFQNGIKQYQFGSLYKEI